uniref:Uncharacterized protein LOC100183826 n=1 Tax=Phallusia mammillata TaxID=59560 RepID=A0A6F9DH91_9ASCI|nr:uncharacterized protein LOC100183826 [Phallusia mammillata]
MNRSVFNAREQRTNVVTPCEQLIHLNLDPSSMVRKSRKRSRSQDSQSPLVTVAPPAASSSGVLNSQPCVFEQFAAKPQDFTEVPEQVDAKHDSEKSDENERIREENRLLSTYRHKFIKRIPRSDQHDRQKWLVRDVVADNEVVLHKIASDYQSANPCSTGEFGLRTTCRRRSFQHVGRGHVAESQIEMSRDFFREVILMRCVRKCSFILKCHGFVLDNQRNLYISTEQFGEEPLSRFQERSLNQVLPEKQVRAISQQLLRALGYMHSIRICHNEIRASNIIVSHQPSNEPPSRACPDVEGRLHVKVGNFHLARDFATWVECQREFECFKCRPVSKIGSRCAKNRFQAMRCHPGYDMLCFAHLLFRCLRGTSPWTKECSCDKHYTKHCKRLARIRAANFSAQHDFGNATEEQPLIAARNNHSHIAQRTAKTLSKMKKGAMNKSSYETKDAKKSWKNFSRKFAECLELLLSDREGDRPSANELTNSASPYSQLFNADNSSCTWTRRALRENIMTTCVYSETRR